jgi:NAD(P)-dependent dehydrogenase (short-subunit alcohol dehydrogenase family)|tara:strand:+ start:1681 stop:2481 length:801 start_codon:yes stop_codon:yes gene_type:complete
MSKSLFDVSNKVIVITGASGQLGLEYVKAFIGVGAKVAALDINFNDEFANFSQDSFHFYKTDILSKNALTKTLHAIQDNLGEPTVLINNAGIDSSPSETGADTGPFESFPEASWDKVMDVNLKGTFLCCQVFGGQMAVNNSGSIINISSIYGIVSPDQSLYNYKNTGKDVFFKPVAYSASKSGVINLTKYLATYWAAKNVRVNTLTIAGVWNNQDKEFLQNYSNRIPIGRMAQQDDYNGALIFLASESSTYMTGSNMIIDGGWTAI